MRISIPQAATAVGVPVAAVLYPDLVPSQTRQDWAWIVAFILLATGAVLLGTQVVTYFMLVRHRGIVRILPTSSRDKAYEEVYTWAKNDLLVWGVAMSKVSKESDTFKKLTEDRINVIFEMTDPIWLAEQPQLCDLLIDFYRMPGILKQMQHSHTALQSLAHEVNRSDRHLGRIEIRLVQGFDFSSGTVADPMTEQAHGVVERHQYGAPTRFAMRYEARDYQRPGWVRRVSEQKSVLRETLEARQRFAHETAEAPSASFDEAA